MRETGGRETGAGLVGGSLELAAGGLDAGEGGDEQLVHRQIQRHTDLEVLRPRCFRQRLALCNSGWGESSVRQLHRGYYF